MGDQIDTVGSRRNLCAAAGLPPRGGEALSVTTGD
jgi:hypothetical protein